ncbi:MAG TPA: autotransporter outer membrane beta-barrel domain-containing protein [Myxococcaceae bacterium]|nr:autotransporter outer membrane beta-barrel domain-containing protein [Myxococcaceae bacterium]
MRRELIAVLTAALSLIARREVWAAGTQVEQGASASPKPAPIGDAPTRWGLLLDAGIPDGIGLSAVYRPFRPFRFHGGLVTNTASYGLRAGVTYVPFYFAVSPSLTLEGGHLFEGDLSFLQAFGLSQEDAERSRFKYNFANAHVGLEMGSPRRFLFFLRAGLSYVDVTFTQFQSLLQSASGSQSVEAQPAHLRATGPSAKLGFVVYFL